MAASLATWSGSDEEKRLFAEVSRHMEVRKSGLPDAGKGVFWEGTNDLPSGVRIGVYIGKPSSRMPADTTYTLQIGSRYYNSAKPELGNWTRYANDGEGAARPGDRKRNNAHFDDEGCVVTSRRIRPHDEVLVSYGDGYWDTRR